MIIKRLFKLLLYRIKKRSTVLKRVYRTKKVFIYLLLIIVVLTVVSWYTRDTKQKDMTVDYGISSYDELREDLHESFIENKNNGCAVPLLDPFDREAMKLDKPASTGLAVCEGEDLVECYLDECFVSKQYRKKLKHWFCMYRDVLHYGGESIGPRKTLPVHQKYRLEQSDIVEVSCFGASSSSDSSSSYWTGHKAGLRHVAHRKRVTNDRRLSIMMLAFKSMSKNGFIRKMPKSYAALKKIGAFIFNGYNVVGERSFGSYFPIFVGKTVIEYFENRIDFDKNHLLFHQLSKNGYRTAHFEDSPFLGIFQHKFNIFTYPLTDHYVLPFLKEVFGNIPPGNKSFCLGDTPLYRTLLNLTHQFLQLDGNHFSFTFISDFNRDNFNMHAEADEVLSSFLYDLQQDPKMKETVLFVMGDQGRSSSSFRETIQGKLEERLPLMAILVPELLNQMKPGAAAALKANVDLLITPFDIHTTLTDILGIGDHRNRHKVPGADMERGLSLLKPIPVFRSCGEAGVQPIWCVCASWYPLPLEDPMYKEIANMLVDYINKLIRDWSHFCQTRTLVHIEYVASQLSKERLSECMENQKHDHRTYSNHYQAKIIVGPGRAIFEGSIRHLMQTNTYIFGDAELIRIDPYTNAKESECIRKDFPFLNKFCYCVNYTDTSVKDMNKTNKQ